MAKTTPNVIEGGVAGGGTSGDRHLIIVDRDRWVLYEMAAARWNSSSQRWEANVGAIFDLASNARRPEEWTSSDAAGLAILPGLVRYDEAVRGPIRHAMRVTVRATNGYAWPASHRAGSNSQALPMGARLRLKASKDLSAYRPEIQRIFHAMQRYGLIVADNGSDMYVSGAFDPRWNNDILNPAFRSLTASDFDVIELGWRGAAVGPCQTPGAASPFSFSQSGPMVVLVWAAAAGAQDYVIEVGSSPGLSNILVAPLGATTTLTAMAPPGRYYARIRARNACGLGAASNEIVVVI